MIDKAKVHQYITEHEAIGPAFKDPQGRSGLWKTAYSELPDIMKEGSYLFYEFKDIETEYNIDDEHPEQGTYIKYISPLCAASILDDADNQQLMNIIDDELPFYHIAPEGFDPKEELADGVDPAVATRDLGTNDVPSYLQTEFWYHWFRDVQGYIQNYVLLDTFNKLRYPYVNENQYLNASLFPELALKAFNPSNDGGTGVKWEYIASLTSAAVGDKWKINNVDGAPESFKEEIQVGDYIICKTAITSKIDPEKWADYWKEYKRGASIIQFKTTAEDNAEDLTNPNFTGCLDYLNDVVNKKLSSSYAMIDYNPDPSNLLSDWSDSLYESGKATKDEVEREKIIFRLQDINYELLKRKFAGSATLYSLALSSIDRSGSFASIIRVGDLASSSVTFKDKRFIRILNVPGILASYPDITDLDPIDTFYQIPLDEGETEIPLGVVTPLFYTSATTSKGAYDSGAFYNSENLSTSLQDYRSAFLRDNISVVDWNNPTGISSSSSINSVWEKMDTRFVDPITHETRYRTLDDTYYSEEESYPMRLDISTPTYKASSIIGNVLDITANRLLYHRNTLQKELGALYPYLVYPIADNNSVSLMDLSWISYLKDSTSRKSRVQDDVAFGEQISRYTLLSDPQVSEYHFFGISYGNSDTDYITKKALSDFTSKPKYAFLWYYELQYNSDTFAVVDVKSTLMTKVVLSVAANPQFEHIEAFQELENRNVGLLPFTYRDMKGASAASLRLGIYNDDGTDRFFDDITDFGYAKAYFVFSDYDMLVNNSNATGSPDAINTNYFHKDPTAEVKTFYYIVNKEDDEKPYAWSEPVRIIPLNSTFDSALAATTFIPDYKELGYHLNPYLNFTANSASAIRHKEVICSWLDKDMSTAMKEKVLVGPSEHCGISNLARSRHMDAVCNDSGEYAPTHWVSDWETKFGNSVAKTVNGMYLDRVRPTNATGFDITVPEWTIIKGDNRYQDVYDESTLITGIHTPEREVIYKGDLQVSSINITKGTATESATSANTSWNYLRIVPGDPDIDSGANSPQYSDWWWNTNNDGITACMNITLSPDMLNTTSTLCRRENEFHASLVVAQSALSFHVRFYDSSAQSHAVVLTITESFTEALKRNYRLTTSAITKNGTTYLYLVVNNSTSTASFTGTLRDKLSLNTPITIGTQISSSKQINNFYGDIYDLRLYNCGHTLEQCILLNAGLTREQYSYSPAAYKLGYSIYNDLGVLRTICDRDDAHAGALPNIKSVRIFNRSVWDSELVDMYRMSDEEKSASSAQYISSWYDPIDDYDIYDEDQNLTDCVEVILEDNSEIYNGVNPMVSAEHTCQIKYDGQLIDVGVSDAVSILNTSVYPVDYDKADFISGGQLEYNSTTQTAYTEEVPISIPVSPTAGTLKYSADLALNFTSAPTFDFSNWYSRGSNVALTYNSYLNQPVATLKTTTLRSSNDNHILIPLRVPKQTALAETTKGYMDRLNVKGLQFNSGITTFLRATSYYNELRVPVAKQPSLTSLPTYTSKWDAIRCLREGTYYFTCKYPVQILPFMDYAYNTSANVKYTTVYASARFKIEVTGNTIVYDPTKYAISGYPNKYLSDNIANTLSSSNGLIVDTDNRTFPHRQINIDLYVQDVSGVAGKMDDVTQETEDYTFQWRLIGSNHPTDYSFTDIITLNKETLEKSLVLTEEIPLFLSKNYSSPMFIAKSKKIPGGEEYDSLSADDDFIVPYDVKPVHNTSSLAAENIISSTESDMDEQCLIAGRAYKMLMDYSGRMSEISFADDTFTPGSASWSGKKYTMTDAEKKNFCRLVNLLDTTTSSTADYMYTGNSNWSATKDFNVKGRTSGYHIKSDNTWDAMGASGANYYFGNPYSRSSSSNYILSTNAADRTNVDSSLTFAYLPEDVPTNTYQSSAYLTQLDTVATKQNSAVYTIKTLNISELNAIENQWSKINGTVTSALNTLKSDASGLFTAFSKVTPNFIYSGTATPNTVDYIYASECDLYGYYASGRSVASKNGNILITRRGLYSNNLITNQNYQDNTAWTLNVSGTYVPDTYWDHGVGKDVFQITTPASAAPAIIKYNTGSKIVGAKYEAAINIYSANIENVTAKVRYIVSNGSSETVTSEVTLTKTAPSQDNTSGWYIFEAETDSVVNADKVAFLISTPTAETVKFTKLVIRKSESTSHYLGLSDALYATSTAADTSRVSLADHRAILYKDLTTEEVIPVQLNNLSRERNLSVSEVVSYAESGQNRVAAFINAHSLGFDKNSSKMEILFEPWVRRLYYWQKYTSRGKTPVANKVVFYKYGVGVDSSGIKTRQIVASPIEDIYTTTGTSLSYTYTGSYLDVNSLKFVSISTIEDLDMNLVLNTTEPITLQEENFSCLANCFNPSRYGEGLSTPIAVTNIQLMSSATEEATSQRLYELEYLPLIYDEQSQHFSLNLFFHQKK